MSCLIANAVLYAADKILETSRAERDFEYMRYCDDMILLSPNRTTCEALFENYEAALKELLLPAHPAHAVKVYGKDGFWNSGKSKSTYEWSNPKIGAGVPWIQFVGYQIRWDGLVRIRPSSLKKEHEKITKAGRDLLRELRKSTNSGGIRRNRHEILHRFRQRLISMAVGRARVCDKVGGTLPMCWANGFRGLISKRILMNGIKRLDHSREHQVALVRRMLRQLPQTEQAKKKGKKLHRFYGRPFSYSGPFL